MALSTSTVNGFTVEIHYDQDGESPRGWTHGCELAYSHRRYDFPNDAGVNFDDFGGWAEIAEHLTETEGALVVLPVNMIDHSGLAFRVGRGFPEDPGGWDSGQIGLAYVTPKNWEETQGTPWTGSEADQEQARRLIESDVETYGQYVNGEVYGYVIKDFDGEQVESLWGMYGYDYAEQEAADVARGLTHEAKCSGTLNRHSGELEHEGPCALHPDA